MEKGSDFRSTDRTRIILHPYNLTTALTQTQMSAWEHNRVLSNTEANYAFFLRVVWVSLGCIVRPEDVIDFENVAIILEQKKYRWDNLSI